MSLPRFLAACRREPVDRPPVWIMRQAGRYLPEYRATRAQAGSFLALCRTPELAAEVTLQPIRRFGFDAAIIFSDILLPLAPMGVDFEFPDSGGPRIEAPLGDPAAWRTLRVPSDGSGTEFVAEAIVRVREALPPEVPLIGFSGAPWTLASYLVEGGTSRDHAAVRAAALAHPEAFAELLDTLAETMAAYLRQQVDAGAQAVQVFDSWAGTLAPRDYAAIVVPSLSRLLERIADLGVPRIVYAGGGPHLLPVLAGLPCEVIGVDWRAELRQAAALLPGKAVQGNLDPAVLFSSPDRVAAATRRMLEEAPASGYIANLGHGILPETPVESVIAFLEAIKGAKREAWSVVSGQWSEDTEAKTGTGLAGKEKKEVEFGSITAELLGRYDRPGPRYTSYPTAPQFVTSFGATEYEAALACAGERAGEPLSLYVHVPFCEARCTYCGCSIVVSPHRGPEERYLDAVERELELLAAHLGERRTLSQLHWGGGTPTYLTPAQCERLFEAITRRFRLDPTAEVAIEVDPCVTTDDHLVTLRRLGFNRISLGVQDFDRKVQEAVHRVQPLDLTRRMVARARELGFGSVNIDLIYGLPYQTAESFAAAARTAIAELSPDRVAAFSYAHVPWIKPHQKALEGMPLPRGWEKFRIFAAAAEEFLAVGYRFIGMDHFAKPGDELARALDTGTLHRNFMGYTVLPASDQVGVGVTSIGDVAGCYVQNEKNLARYERALEAGHLPVERGLARTAEDDLRGALIRRLICTFRLDFAWVEERFGIDPRSAFAPALAELAPFAADGLVEIDDNGIRVLPRGHFFIRNICMPFDAYLSRDAGKQVYSRTV